MQWKLIWIGLVLVTMSGCAAPFAAQTSQRPPAEFTQASTGQPSEIQIQRGRPNRIVDGIGDVLGLPDRIALWDRRVNNHKISTDTEAQLVRYMAANGLESTLVRANQYHPLGEWKRLFQNKEVGAGWRYTFGTYNLLKYTFLPGRLTGGDWYNPYTDTINLSSDVPGLALFAAAYAKDAKSRKNTGLYTAVQEFPIVGLQHETIATKDVMNYAKKELTDQKVAEYRQTLLPNYGATVGSQLASFFPYGNVIGRLAGAAFGHVGNQVTSPETHQAETIASHGSPATSTIALPPPKEEPLFSVAGFVESVE